MKKDSATKVVRLVDEASAALHESVKRVQEQCSEDAFGLYRSVVGRVMGGMVAGLLFPLWAEHPEVEPECMKGGSSYNPRTFEMPAVVAAEALRVLAHARGLMAQVEAVLSSEGESAAGPALLHELRGVLKEMEDVEAHVHKQRSVGGKDAV